DTLLSMQGVPEAITGNAQLVKAQSLLKTGKAEDALPVYRQLEKSADGAVAAEARYNIAQIYFKQNMLKEAEAAALNTVKLSGGQDYWVVKSYLLLADILVQQKDYFN